VRRRAPLLPSLSRSSICANHKGNRSRYHVIDGTRQCMSSNSEGLARTVFVLESDEAFRPSGMISQAEDGRFRRGPLELGMAHFGAGAARALAVRCLGARDQTTGGGTRLDPREAAEVVDFVEQYETENRADAWYGLPQRQGVLVMLGAALRMVSSTSRSSSASSSVRAWSTAILFGTAGSGHRSATPSRFAC
jgi:hypothetical protein